MNGKICALLAALLLLLTGHSLAANVGYYDMSSQQGVSSQAAVITTAGETPVLITDLSAGDLAGIDVLFVQNPSNGSYGFEYTSRLADIEAAVNAGMVLIIHDRYVTAAESILPGGAGFTILRDFTHSRDIDVLDDTTLVTDGPGGIINDTSLDLGTSSSHGYTEAASLPGDAVLLLSTTDPTHIVTFAYPFGAGWVIYSTIPLDFYLNGSGGIRTQMQNYAANVVAYAANITPSFLAVTPASGDEDTAIPLDISLNPDFPDLGDLVVQSIVISGVPDGASLSAGIDNGDGTWDLTLAELDGLQLFPPADSNVDITLTVTAEALNALDELVTAVQSLFVDLIGVADDPTLATQNTFPFGLQIVVPVEIEAELTDTDSSETLTVTISNVPDDAFLSAGVNMGGGNWLLTPADLNGLRIALPFRLRYYVKWDLGVAATATEDDGSATTLMDTIKVIYLEAFIDDDTASDGNDDGTVIVVTTDGDSGGGCSLGGAAGIDPMFPLLAFGALGYLVRRRKD